MPVDYAAYIKSEAWGESEEARPMKPERIFQLGGMWRWGKSAEKAMDDIETALDWPRAFRSWGLDRDSDNPQAVYEAGTRHLYRTMHMPRPYYDSGLRALRAWLGIEDQ